MAITEPRTPRRTVGSGLDVFSDIALPPWARIRQQLDGTDIGSIADAIAREFAKPGIGDQIQPGSTVALTAGSRGIDRIAEVLRACVDEVRNRGGEPFIIPAMGSHGGATAEGQTALIAHYGVTEEAMGAPIRASMETVELGTLDDGVPVWFDRIAHDTADLVIPVGRVKPHTDFRGPVESGLMKMIAIGLGKQHGASWFHSQGMHTFGDLIPRVAAFTMAHEPIPFGIALVENGHCKLALAEAVPAAAIREREEELLEIAKAKLAGLPEVERLDVLIVDEIGKDVSGDGADPNVIHRATVDTMDFSGARPLIQRCIARGLTEDTDGNATGIGMFDFTLERLVAQMDPVPTYMNTITAKSPAGARVPITVATDRQALTLAVASGLKVEPGNARIMRIQSTKHLEELHVSAPVLEELQRTGVAVEVLDDIHPIAYDADGMFAE
jgi:hypothetical protein